MYMTFTTCVSIIHIIRCGCVLLMHVNVHVYCLHHSQDKVSGEIVFYMKGADAVMSSIVQYSDWLEEEVYT